MAPPDKHTDADGKRFCSIDLRDLDAGCANVAKNKKKPKKTMSKVLLWIIYWKETHGATQLPWLIVGFMRLFFLFGEPCEAISFNSFAFALCSRAVG